MARKRVKSCVHYPSARVLHLVIWLRDKSGKIVMSHQSLAEKIDKHEGGYLTYAYILHDKDVYNAEAVYQNEEKNRKTFIDRYQILAEVAGLERDETSITKFVMDSEIEAKARAYADEQFPKIEVEEKKPEHWHVILTFAQNRKIDEIARWFDIEPNWIECKSGRGASESAWNYLVHAKDKTKHPYDPKEVYASFDYVNELEARLAKDERQSQYHMPIDDINDILEEVAQGLPLSEVRKKIAHSVYIRNKRLFEDAREYYVKNFAPMPMWREVFYVESEGIDADHGKGGVGKTACTRALAKQLAKEFGGDPTKDVTQLEDYIFTAGDANVFLDGYDGQPILVINEISGADLKRACKGVNGVKELLDPFPEKKALNKKYGSTICLSKYIIINGIQSFERFKTELAESIRIDGIVQASELSVKEQFDRRFWANVRIINSSEVEFWVNRGLFANTGERELMELVRRVRVNFKTMNRLTAGEALARIEGQVLQPLSEQVELANQSHSHSNKITNWDEVPDEVKRFGEEVYPEPMTMAEWEMRKAEEERRRAEWQAKYYDEDDEPLPF